MAKYRGRVDCYTETPVDGTGNPNSRANGEFFTNLVQHISASKNALGIEMLAWSYGNGGTGWNFWDETGTTGPYAFACFRFHSASLGSFDCLVYMATGSYVTHTGSVYVDNSQNSSDPSYGYHQVGISFACHLSGTVPTTPGDTTGPWDGSYGEGANIKTDGPIWKLGAESKGAFFPRQNGISGDNATNRDYMLGISGYQINDSRYHFILSEDSLTILLDPQNAGKYRIMHFGPYLPRSGVYADSPYFLWSSGDENSYAPWHAQYGIGGLVAGTGRGSNVPQGGIAHPDLLSGSKAFGFGLLNVGAGLSLNPFVESGSFEKFPAWLVLAEGGEANYVGLAKHVSVGYMMNLTVSTLSSSCAFGRMSSDESKWIVPWVGNPPHTTPFVRTGRNFSIG